MYLAGRVLGIFDEGVGPFGRGDGLACFGVDEHLSGETGILCMIMIDL